MLKECDIEGASDSSIKNAVPNDISVILNSADIKAVFTTGTTAGKLYKKFIEPKTEIPAKVLPSTSPANAKIKFEKKQQNIDCDLLIYEPIITPNNDLYIDLVKNKFPIK